MGTGDTFLMKNYRGNDCQIGDIIRYGEGCSALARINSRHSGGFHAEHVLGGFRFCYDHGWGSTGIFKASEEDIEYCKHKKPEWFK